MYKRFIGMELLEGINNVCRGVIWFLAKTRNHLEFMSDFFLTFHRIRVKHVSSVRKHVTVTQDTKIAITSKHLKLFKIHYY